MYGHRTIFGRGLFPFDYVYRLRAGQGHPILYGLQFHGIHLRASRNQYLLCWWRDVQTLEAKDDLEMEHLLPEGVAKRGAKVETSTIPEFFKPHDEASRHPGH